MPAATRRTPSGSPAPATASAPCWGPDVGAFLGLLLGTGLFLVWRACTSPPRPKTARGWRDRVEEQLAQAGIEGVAPGRLAGASVTLGLVAFVVMAGVSKVAVVALPCGLLAAALPFNLVRARRR